MSEIAEGAPLQNPELNIFAQIDSSERDSQSKIGSFTDWKQFFASIETIVDQTISQEISTLSNENVNELIDLVKQRREKLPLSSSTNSPIIGICQNILAFGAAGLALTVGFVDKISNFSITVQKLVAIAGIFYLELVLIAIAVLCMYLLQARFRYPFIYFEKIGNTWPFFYYGVLTPVSRLPIQTSRQRFHAAVAYAKDFVKFSSLVIGETPKQRLRSEIQQYFLFVSYQSYAHQFALRLVRLFSYGFASAIGSATLLLILVWRGML